MQFKFRLKMIRLFTLLIVCIIGCNQPGTEKKIKINPGAHQLNEYLPLIKDKRIGLTVNHSSKVAQTHLIDTLHSLSIQVSKVFTPEHGFTGTVSDGVNIKYDSTNYSYELISLYGKNKKPSVEQMTELDVMIFDIQDVGTRFYTYISTMHYIMEACAENDIPLIILDRPNPNGSYVDGPILDMKFQSFVGMHPIPIVHGMTIGELAQMINEEGWLSDQMIADLTIIKIENWDHDMRYSLPLKPSPNLPNDLSISLYPSLCLFEGTIMSVGRGTDNAFQQVGHPDYPDGSYSFIPVSRIGAKWPPYEDLICYGQSWIGTKPKYSFSLKPLIEAYQKMNREDFFNDYFKRLAGTDQLQPMIEQGMTEEEIRKTWESDLTIFKQKRASYLLYK